MSKIARYGVSNPGGSSACPAARWFDQQRCAAICDPRAGSRSRVMLNSTSSTGQLTPAVKRHARPKLQGQESPEVRAPLPLLGQGPAGPGGCGRSGSACSRPERDRRISRQQQVRLSRGDVTALGSGAGHPQACRRPGACAGRGAAGFGAPAPPGMHPVPLPPASTLAQQRRENQAALPAAGRQRPGCRSSGRRPAGLLLAGAGAGGRPLAKVGSVAGSGTADERHQRRGRDQPGRIDGRSAATCAAWNRCDEGSRESPLQQRDHRGWSWRAEVSVRHAG